MRNALISESREKITFRVFKKTVHSESSELIAAQPQPAAPPTHLIAHADPLELYHI
jgi:hypothetical protein